jgi:uncharacterized membrane protein YebE (DUF533 family)
MLLKIGCVLAGIAGIGLITGAMLALTIDTEHVTTAGTIGAISAGGMLAVLWVALVVNWYGKRTRPAAEEEEPSEEKPKASSSKQKPSPSKA